MSSMLLFYLLSFLTPLKPGSPAPPAQVVYKHTLAESNVILSTHLRPFADGFFDRLEAFGQEEFIKNNPGFSRAYATSLEQIKKAFDEFSQNSGIDPLKDIHFMTLSMYATERKPHILIALGGKFNEKQCAMLAKWMNLQGPTTQQNGYTVHQSTSKWRRQVLALSPDGQLLFSERDTLQKYLIRANDGLGLVARMAQQQRPGDLFSFGFDPHSGEMPKIFPKLPGTIRDLLAGWKTIHLSTQIQQADINVWTTGGQALRRTTSLMRGIEAFAKAGDLSVRGMLNLLDGLLEDDSSKLPPSPFGAIFQHKKALLRILREQFGTSPLASSLRSSSKESVHLTLQGRLSSNIAILVSFGGFPAFFLFRQTSRRAMRPSRRYPRAYPAKPPTVPPPHHTPHQPPPPLR